VINNEAVLMGILSLVIAGFFGSVFCELVYRWRGKPDE